MAEKSAHAFLKRNGRRWGRWYRVENGVSAGWPDTLFIRNLDGRHVWFELKELTFKARCNAWHIRNLRPGQIGRMRELNHLKTPVFMVLKCRTRYYIVPALEVFDHGMLWTDMDLEEHDTQLHAACVHAESAVARRVQVRDRAAPAPA